MSKKIKLFTFEYDRNYDVECIKSLNWGNYGLSWELNDCGPTDGGWELRYILCTKDKNGDQKVQEPDYYWYFDGNKIDAWWDSEVQRLFMEKELKDINEHTLNTTKKPKIKSL